MKKVFCVMLTLIITMSLESVCFASDGNTIYGDAKRVTIERSEEEIYEISDVAPTTSNGAKLSWGEGILHTSNPLFGKPSAYAETKTYSGTAYCMYAQLGLVDDESISYLTDKQQANNVSTISSATLQSNTKKCVFVGYHGLQDTVNTGWQTVETGKSF